MKLKIVSGAIEIYLTENGVRLFDYGIESSRSGKETASERARLLSLGGNDAFLNTLSLLNKIKSRIEQEKQTPLVSKSYLYITMYQKSGVDIWYRSQLKSLSVDMPDSLFVTDFLIGHMQAELNWERAAFWEAEIEESVYLTNRNGTNITSGLTVYNHYDSRVGRDNFFVAEAITKGDIACEPTIEIANTYNSSARIQQIAIGVMKYGASSFKGVLEAESGLMAGGTVSGASYSNSAFKTYNVPANQNDMMVDGWTVSSAMLSETLGGYFKVLAHFPYTASFSLWYKFRLRYGPMELWSSDWNKLGTLRYILSTQAVQLPPKLVNVPTAAPLTLELYCRNTLPNPVSFGLDFVRFLPVDNYRVLRSIGFGLANGTRVIDNQSEDSLIVEGYAGGSVAIFAAEGGKISLEPGLSHKLFIAIEGDSDAYPDRTVTVKMRYRPRYATLPNING